MPQEPVPDLVGKNLEVALAELEGMDYYSEFAENVNTDEETVSVVGGGTFGVIEPNGWVVCRQSPQAGGVLTENSKLILTAERSYNCEVTASRSVEIPNLVGMVLGQTNSTLRNAGLLNRPVAHEPECQRLVVDEDNWRIVSQDPAPGAEARADTKIRVAVEHSDFPCPDEQSDE